MSIAISVIIATNKPKLYLADCLNSLARQTFKYHFFEIVVVINGCSFDEYIKCCEEWNDYRNYIFFKFIYEQKGGISKARNIGLNHASGVYIAFIDDDDVVSTNYLEKLYECVNTNEIAIANVRCFKKDMNDYYSDYLGMSFARLKHKNYNLITHRSFLSTCCAKLIPMSVIGNNRFNESIDRGEDGLLMASIIHKVTALKLTSKDCIYNRRVVSNSLSRAKKGNHYIYKQRMKLILCYINIWLKNPIKSNLFFILSRIVATGIHLVKKT